MAKAVTPACASACSVSGWVRGARKPTSVPPRCRRPISSALGGADLDHHVGAPRVADARAGVGVERVGDERLLAGAGLDDDLDALGLQALDDVRHERDAALAFGALSWHSDLHEGAEPTPIASDADHRPVGSATGRSWLTASAKRCSSVPSSKARAADATPAASVPVTTHTGRSSGRLVAATRPLPAPSVRGGAPVRVEHGDRPPVGRHARVDAAGARPVLERVGRRIEAQRGPRADEHAQRLRRPRGLQPAAAPRGSGSRPAGRRPAGRRARGRRRTRCARAGACRRCRAGRARGTSRRRPGCPRWPASCRPRRGRRRGPWCRRPPRRR